MQGNNRIVIVLIFSLLLVLIGCKPSELESTEYIKYIKSEKSNLYKKREVGDYRFEVFYQPLDYKIALQLKDKLSIESYNKIKEKTDGLQYFTLKISPLEGSKSILKYNLRSEEEYQARLAYFSFGMQKNVFLETDNKNIDCGLYHFERAYDLSNFRVFDLGFEDLEPDNKDKTLIIHSDFFGTGPIKFKFKEEDLKDLPKLIIE